MIRRLVRIPWQLLLAFVPFIGGWTVCGYAGCVDVGPRSFYCSQHREPLSARLRLWWRVWVKA